MDPKIIITTRTSTWTCADSKIEREISNIKSTRLWLPKPPLDVTGTTSSGKAPCYDQGIERAVKYLMAKATW